MCEDSNLLIIGHLGNIEINNGSECINENSRKRHDNFKSSSRSAITKSMDGNLNQSSEESSSDLEKEIFNQTISDSTKFRVNNLRKF